VGGDAVRGGPVEDLGGGAAWLAAAAAAPRPTRVKPESRLAPHLHHRIRQASRRSLSGAPISFDHPDGNFDNPPVIREIAVIREIEANSEFLVGPRHRRLPTTAVPNLIEREGTNCKPARDARKANPTIAAGGYRVDGIERVERTSYGGTK
jgi:hypothetical protein